MFKQDYLSLRLFRLRSGEKWGGADEGLIFIFPHSGSGQLVTPVSARELRPGEVLVVNGSAITRLGAADKEEVVFWSFSVRLEHLFPLFASHELGLLSGVSDELKAIRLYEAGSPVSVECHRLLTDMPPTFTLDHRGQLVRVATAILSAEFKRERSARTGFIGVEEHMTQVLEKLAFDEILNLSVDELAERFGCSRRHLNRLFHQYFGFSVASLRMEMRLLKAVSLLRDPGAKIIHVAEQCGFNHLGLFNTCFKRRFGVSPGQWRKARQEGEAKRSGALASEADCRLRTMGLCPWCDELDETAGTGRRGRGTKACGVSNGNTNGKEPARSFPIILPRPDHPARERRA